MCGFVGAVGPEALNVSLSLNAHLFTRRRGPDSEGSTTLGHFGWLYAARLAFQDPRSLADQPFHDDSRNTVLAYNGEAFNYNELRSLLDQNTNLVTRSDTELVGNLLLQRGPDFLGKFDGPFAFAFFDKSKGLLTLARDPMGRKPLYYSMVGQTLLFGSDAHALGDLVKSSRTLSDEGLRSYLHLGFVGPSESGYLSIQAVQPGEVLTWSATSSAVHSRTYISPLLPSFVSSTKTDTDQPSQVRRALLEAIRTRAGDEKSALSLSGGLDSTAILIAAKELNLDVTPFSVYWPTSDKDRYSNDANAARAVTAMLGTNHRLVEGLQPEQISLYMRRLRDVLGSPNANPTSLTQLHLQEVIRSEGIRITLTGDGSDEIFLGYPRYLSVRRFHPLIRSDFLANILFKFRTKNQQVARITSVLGRLGSSTENPLSRLSWHQLHSPHEIRQLTGQQPDVHQWLTPSAAEAFAHLEKAEKSDVALQAHWDRMTWLTHESNAVGDAVSMGLAGEVRCPFQSKILLEVLARGGVAIDQDLGLKPLLRSAFPEISTVAVLESKQGFISPLGHWLRGNIEEVETMTLGLPQAVGIEAKPVKDLVARWRTTPHEGDIRRMWALWSLAVWMER